MTKADKAKPTPAAVETLHKPKPSKGPLTLLIATRKGAFFLRGSKNREKWKLSDPMFLGHMVHHIVQDPRDPKSLLMACRTGHLGPTVFRSTDLGKSWVEAHTPPSFPKAPEGENGRVVDHVFWLTPGHASEPGIWYAGSSPQGLFRSEDAGVTWEGVTGFNDHPMRETWTGGGGDGTPDGPKMHSILIDPRDADHMYIGMSSGGVFESTNRGVNWKPLNKGSRSLFSPVPDADYGQDPHSVKLHPLNPDRLYQQNHCGIYRMDRDEGVWVRVGENMPKGSRRYRFSDGASPARSEYRLGVSDGRHGGLASHESRRQACRLCDSRRGRKVETIG